GAWPATDTPSITVNDVTVIEGNSGTTAATFTVSLSAAYGQAVSVHYSTADNGAVAGSDYQAVAGTLTFAPGVTSQTITVLVNGDRVGESDESFSVNLTGTTAGLISTAQALGYIVNDEPIVIMGGDTTVQEGNSGTRSVTFSLALSAASDAPVTIT